jgi:hypothetical protein
MENRHIDLSKVVRKFDSIEATIIGPTEAKNGKMFYKASFMENTADDGGYLSQAKAYIKCFFEDSHSLIFRACEKAVENGTALKIKGARVIMPTAQEFYILDAEGKRIPKKNGGFRKASSITLFLMADENPASAFAAQCNQITNNDAWIKEEVAEDDADAEEETAKNTKKK